MQEAYISVLGTPSASEVRVQFAASVYRYGSVEFA